jgi:5-amino-6-(5-phosphoribosylamino)uracil reductase
MTETDTLSPRVLLSVAVSLDGCLDDLSQGRLRLSSDEDADEVDALRAASDAVLVGAGTAREDDPRLTIRSAARRAARRLVGRPDTPARIVVTRTAKLDPRLHVLSVADAETLLYCPASAAHDLSGRFGPHVTIVCARPMTLRHVLQDAARRSLGRVVIEAGELLSSEVLRRDLADELRVAIAPVIVGRRGAPRLFGALREAATRGPAFVLAQARSLGGVAVLHYLRPGRGAPGREGFAPRTGPEWLAEAIELAGRCSSSRGAYSVGACLVAPDGQLIATGFSRELDERVHAEEAALLKASRQGCSVTGATLYSSMEPCSVRLSGRVSCADLIVRAGIRRVIYALDEPPVFVAGQGRRRLEEVGVEVARVPGLAPHAAQANKHLLTGAPQTE